MSKFQDLVESLDHEKLDELRRSVAAEMTQRRQQSGIQMEHIHAGMTDEQRTAAMLEIARVLRGEE